MKKEYDIEKVIELRDSQNLKWKEIEENYWSFCRNSKKSI